jgi:hypothetical protein
MKRSRSTLFPLPRYTLRKAVAAGGFAYYFNPPSWAIRAAENGDERGPCPVAPEALGTDYEAALRVADTRLKLFDSWRTGGLSDMAPERAQIGTLDWLVAEYRASEKHQNLSRAVRKLREAGLSLVANHSLKDGRRFGAIALARIDTATVDRLYKKLLFVREQVSHAQGKSAVDPGGKPITQRRERRTTINHAMKSCRRAWNVVRRAQPKHVPSINPFSAMGLREASQPVPEASFEELNNFVRVADDAGEDNLGTAAWIAFEWAQREEHIFRVFSLSDHYRPKARPDSVLILHPKTGEACWIPLIDPDSHAALYPELMERLDALKRDRVGIAMMRNKAHRDGKLRSWMTASGDLTDMRHRVKELIRTAGLRDELTFRSFRHGGITEGADADLSDAEIRSLTRQSSRVLPRYAKRTQKQLVSVARKRRAVRSKPGRIGNEDA